MTEEVSVEEQQKAVAEFLANPENEKKNPEAFKKARESGLLVENKVVDPILQEIQSRFGNGYASKEDFYAEVEKYKSGGAGLEFLKTLPDPILTAIDKFTKNEPWQDVFATSKAIDYNKNYNDDELLAIYNPTLFTKEELSSEEESVKKAILTAKAASKKQFLIERQERANEAQLQKTRKEQSERVSKESLESTIADWKKKVLLQTPNIQPSKLSQMEARMRSDLQSGAFLRKFVDERGAFTQEAASNLYPLTFSQDFVAAWKDLGRQEAEKNVHQILDHGGQPRQFNRGTEPPKQKDDTLEKIFMGERKNPYVKK